MKKKEITLCGRLIRPVVPGRTAIYIADGQIHRTSCVVSIHTQTETGVHFETRNAHYHLSMNPLPPVAVSRFPEALAACA